MLPKNIICLNIKLSCVLHIKSSQNSLNLNKTWLYTKQLNISVSYIMYNGIQGFADVR